MLPASRVRAKCPSVRHPQQSHAPGSPVTGLGTFAAEPLDVIVSHLLCAKWRPGEGQPCWLQGGSLDLLWGCVSLHGMALALLGASAEMESPPAWRRK